MFVSYLLRTASCIYQIYDNINKNDWYQQAHACLPLKHKGPRITDAFPFFQMLIVQ